MSDRRVRPSVDFRVAISKGIFIQNSRIQLGFRFDRNVEPRLFTREHARKTLNVLYMIQRE